MQVLWSVMTMKTAAWFFGIGAMLFLFCAYQQKERKNLLLCKLGADICWAIHYGLLGASGGAIPNIVGIFRESVFVNRKKGNRADRIIWPIAFAAANLSLGVAMMKSYIDLLPLVSSALVTVSLWLKDPRITKIISLPVSCAFLVYDVFAGSYIGVINESLAIVSILTSVVKTVLLRIGEKADGKASAVGIADSSAKTKERSR